MWETSKYRDQLLMNAPRWLRSTNAYMMLFAIGTQIDAMADAGFQALKCRYPGLIDPVHTLPKLGRDRRLRRGLFESSDSYARRLTNWLEVNRKRGLGFLLCEQLRVIFEPYDVGAWVIHNRGTDATPAESGRKIGIASNGDYEDEDVDWYWDDTEDLSRFWVVLSLPATLLELDGYWGDAGGWGDGGYWAVEGDSSSYIQTAWSLVSEFTPAHSRLANMIVVPEVELTNFWASPPDGAWDRWENRNPDVLYL